MGLYVNQLFWTIVGETKETEVEFLDSLLVCKTTTQYLVQHEGRVKHIQHVTGQKRHRRSRIRHWSQQFVIIGVTLVPWNEFYTVINFSR